MSKQISYHRLGAFIYGFLCGIGLVMIIWGLASIAMLPSANLMSIILILFGVVLFASGSCREAYLRGNLSMPPVDHIHVKRDKLETTNPISEQVVGYPEEN
jgi:hypothetical protein